MHTPLQNSAFNAAEWDDSSAKDSPSVNGNESMVTLPSRTVRIRTSTRNRSSHTWQLCRGV